MMTGNAEAVSLAAINLLSVIAASNVKQLYFGSESGSGIKIDRLLILDNLYIARAHA